jgi:catechol 2,3-dioxygenase-like lactoylglutathione lyase family enzyme
VTSAIRHVTIDCADPYALALFWADVTGFEPDPENEPGDGEALLVAPGDHPGVLFIRVPEPKSVKNRIHLDVTPTDRRRDEEVERLAGIGARVVDDRRNPDGTGWVVMADPEGNEFCVERSAEERVD